MKLEYDSCIYVGDKLYIFPYGKGYCYYDIKQNATKYLFPDNSLLDNENVTGKIHLWSNKLLFFSQNGKFIFIYDLLKNVEQRKILPSITYRNWTSIIASAVIGNEIVILPKYDSKIIRYDLVNACFIESYVDYGSVLGEDGISKAGIIGNKLIGVSETKRKIFILDIFSNTIEFSLNIPCNKVFSCYIYEKDFYFLSDCGVCKFNIDRRVVEIIINCDKTPGLLIVEKEKIFIFPHLNRDIYEIDITRGKIEKYGNYPEDFEYNDRNWAKYCGYSCTEEYIWLNSRCSNYLARINRYSQKIEWIRTPETGCQDDMKYCIVKSEIVREEGNQTLKGFLAEITE